MPVRPMYSVCATALILLYRAISHSDLLHLLP